MEVRLLPARNSRFDALECKLVEISRQLIVPAFAGHLPAQLCVG